ncbi:MAG: VWA domain-containing protein [Chloroflexota bacterium]|nr:VWA domain-containing protein [Chloroflexota bacterium]
MFDNRDSYWWEGGKKTEMGKEFAPRNLQTALDQITRRQSGRRSRTRTDRKRGRYVRARRIGSERPTDIAFDATLRAAAPYQKERAAIKAKTGMAYALNRHDLHRKVRVRRTANLILFAVDASWSMAVSERMTATKGAIMSLLTDAYQRRDRVGLIVFQKDRAQMILPPTNSVMLAKQALTSIPVGGKTPLSAGLMLAFECVRREKMLHPDIVPLVLVLTDGAGNVSIGNLPPQEEAHRIADMFRAEHIKTVTINMEHQAFDQGLAAKLAERMGGPCYTLGQMRADVLLETVRGAMTT